MKSFNFMDRHTLQFKAVVSLGSLHRRVSPLFQYIRLLSVCRHCLFGKLNKVSVSGPRCCRLACRRDDLGEGHRALCSLCTLTTGSRVSLSSFPWHWVPATLYCTSRVHVVRSHCLHVELTFSAAGASTALVLSSSFSLAL